jgi:hypothetical protein
MLGNSGDMSVLVKMDPSESEAFSDIILTIPPKAHELNMKALDNLEKGDHLKFKAKIRSMGNEFKLHHLRLVDEPGALEDTGKSEDFEHISINESKLP